MKMEKSLKTVTIYHGLKGEHSDIVADTQEVAYGTVALNEFLRHENVDTADNVTIMFDAICHVEVTEEAKTLEIEDETCVTNEPVPEPDAPTITGADDITISEGEDFDPMAGVTATDSEGNPVEVTVEGTVDTETPGEYTLTYTATAYGKTTTITRKVTVAEKSTPIINGANDVTINQGIGIDLKDGVTATLDGEEIEFTVDPETIEKCEVGEHDATYTATGNGKTTTVTRKVTIKQIANPTISGLTDLTVEVGEEFNPLEGVTAKDGNGNNIEVEVVEEEPTDEWELIAELGEGNIISKTVLGTTPLVIGDTLKCVMTMAYDPKQGDQSAYNYESIDYTWDGSSYDAVCAVEFRVDEFAAIAVAYGNGELFAVSVPGDNGVGFQTFKLYKKVA